MKMYDLSGAYKEMPTTYPEIDVPINGNIDLQKLESSQTQNLNAAPNNEKTNYSKLKWFILGAAVLAAGIWCYREFRQNCNYVSNHRRRILSCSGSVHKGADK